MLRYSGIHGLGMVAANIITFASTIVIANFSKPAEFGQLGLLMFYSGLLTLVFTLASKQGTLKRTFGGGDDEEDDDDDEDEELSSDPRHSFGTGLITITVVSLIGTALSIVFADQIANGLLGGGADPNLIVYAALAGGAGPSTASRPSRSGSSVAPTPTSPSRPRSRSSPSPRSSRCWSRVSVSRARSPATRSAWSWAR